jgi:deoxyribodipyrimidine photolyase-related protein
MFLSPVAFLEQQIAHKKKPFMAHFYQAQRKRLGILIDGGGLPTGGKWSFDAENRQRLPKGHRAPELPDFGTRAVVEDAKKYVAQKWPQARGSNEYFRWPVTRDEAMRELDVFLEERFAHFGQYEDAISAAQPWLYHSVLTPVLNIGLITPKEIVDRVLGYAAAHEVPLNSLEGFIRQIIGWREFMRGIYHFRGVQIRNGNHWQHHEPLPPGFDDGTSGIGPADAVVRRLERYAWSHHIERLMVMGNLMVLLRIEPHAAYRWFMEWYIDAYDWVMVPNVYGMSLHADGGTFTTKPYISGSNYILKMSDFPKGLWCGKWDDLFWSFLADHRDFFAKNPRMSVLLKQLDKRAQRLL